jgi:glycosyltransferase involved in cell wall biosynthesis
MTISSGLTVFVPVYNEAALVVANTHRLAAFLDTLGTPWEIILGSNGSTDGTVDLAAALEREIGALHWFHLPDKGVGAAFREGVRRARFEHIVTVDMDLSIELAFIASAHRLLTRCDMVIGSKTTGRQQRAWHRTMASNLFIRLARRLLKIDFHDYSIAAKGYRRSMVRRYCRHLDHHTFYVVSMVYHASRDDKRLIEIPVRCQDLRDSRFNLLHEGIYKFSRLFGLWFRVRCGRWWKAERNC